MTTLYCAILVASFMATASLADIDSQRMQRDIRIMEGVLGNLHHDAPDPTYSSPRGLYLDGYGVLFFTEGSWPGQKHGISVAWDEKGVKFLELKSGDPSSYEKSLTESHDLLAEFLGNYAGIIGQLDPDDRITVCYQRRPSGLTSGLGNIAEGFTVSADSVSFDLTKQIEAIMPIREGAFDFEKLVLTFGDSVSFFDTDKQVAAITRLRNHLEEVPTEGEFEVKGVAVMVRDSLLAGVAEADAPSHGSIVARIHGLTPRHRRTTAAASLITAITATAKKSAIDAFREGRIDSATFRQRIAFSEHSDLKKINIMAGILDQVSGHDHHPLVGTQRTLGMYQSDLGALFFISDSVFRFRPLPIDDVKANIVEAVADYGVSLSQVQSDEHVIVEYRTGRTTRFLQDPEIVKYHPDQTYLLQVSKVAIDAYARGDLDLDAFSKKAVWETQ